MRTALKVVTVNLLMLVGLLLALELGYRAVKLAASCARGSCDGSYLVFGSKFRANIDVDLSREDAVLGHVPNDGTHTLDAADVHPIQVTIREGLRAHGASASLSGAGLTLAIGDSFTFGDEVADEQTWPACLERNLNERVLNGGVFGYGAAQAVLRAHQLATQYRFERIIWSILVEHDFERDTLVARSSTPRPAVVDDGRATRYTTLAESQQIFERTISTGIAKYAALFGYSYISKLLWSRMSPHLLPAGTSYDGRWNVAHPDAAPSPELMRFTFAQFAALPAPEKYVLLQYPQASVKTLSARAVAELETIRRLSAEHQLALIDTLPALRASPDLSSLYQGHHTAAGNRLVCEVIRGSLDEPAATTLSRDADRPQRTTTAPSGR
jgi:hypothetical protein